MDLLLLIRWSIIDTLLCVNSAQISTYFPLKRKICKLKENRLGAGADFNSGHWTSWPLKSRRKICACFLKTSLPNENCNMIKPKLIVHGGAWNIPEDMQQDHVRGVKRAVNTVYPQLLNGMSAIDAVEAAVKILEEDPTFDAGRGAFLNALGEIELDAMIMDGATLDFGAVAAV